MVIDKIKSILGITSNKKTYTVLHREVSSTIPDVRDYMKVKDYDKYSNYMIMSKRNVGAELFVSGEAMTIMVVRYVGAPSGKTTYDTTFIDIGHDLELLPIVMADMVPFTRKKDWSQITSDLAFCIMRESVKNLGERLCSNCNNHDCVFKKTNAACYFK